MTDEEHPSPLSTLIEFNYETHDFLFQDGEKWFDFVDGGDGYLYGIPGWGSRVVRFDPSDESTQEIGPEFDDEDFWWECGVRAGNGCIYCIPGDNLEYGVLKICTITGEVNVLDNIEWPIFEEHGGWILGSVSEIDGNIYFLLRSRGHCVHLLRFDPDIEICTAVETDVMVDNSCFLAAAIINNCLYAISPSEDPEDRFIKADLTECIARISSTGKISDEAILCKQSVIPLKDGCIYSLDTSGRVVKIDTANESHSYIGDGDNFVFDGILWGHPVVGSDKCIYWPPHSSNRVLRFDPAMQQPPALVGDDINLYDKLGDFGMYKWLSGKRAAVDGAIYFIPHAAYDILRVDPFEAYSTGFRKRGLDRIFDKDTTTLETFYETGLRQFGAKAIFSLIEKHTPTDTEWEKAIPNENLPLFAAIASCENSALSVIYLVLKGYVIRNGHNWFGLQTRN